MLEIVIPDDVVIRLNALPVVPLLAAGSSLRWVDTDLLPHRTGSQSRVCRSAEELLACLACDLEQAE